MTSGQRPPPARGGRAAPRRARPQRLQRRLRRRPPEARPAVLGQVRQGALGRLDVAGRDQASFADIVIAAEPDRSCEIGQPFFDTSASSWS